MHIIRAPGFARSMKMRRERYSVVKQRAAVYDQIWSFVLNSSSQINDADSSEGYNGLK